MLAALRRVDRWRGRVGGVEGASACTESSTRLQLRVFWDSGCQSGCHDQLAACKTLASSKQVPHGSRTDFSRRGWLLSHSTSPLSGPQSRRDCQHGVPTPALKLLRERHPRRIRRRTATGRVRGIFATTSQRLSVCDCVGAEHWCKDQPLRTAQSSSSHSGQRACFNVSECRLE